MNLKEAIKVLEEYNSWRIGGNSDMLEPKTITEALNTVLNRFNAVNTCIEDITAEIKTLNDGSMKTSFKLSSLRAQKKILKSLFI